MADWSQLPKDLLGAIADCLHSKTDAIRSRSVCSTWRQSMVSTRCRLSSCSPIIPNDGFSDPAWGMPLSLFLAKRTIFLISLPGGADSGPSWLIKTNEEVPFNLLKPLTRSHISPLPNNFPKTVDTLKFRVLELGIEYVLQYMSFHTLGDPLGLGNNLYMERVAFMCLNCAEFILLTIHVSGKLAVFKSKAKKWSIIGDMPSPYDDVLLHKGEFYAVDCVGRTVTVGLDLTLNLIADPVFGGDKKFLVESVGELLLVDKYLTVDADDGVDTDVVEDEQGFIFHERTVRFKVYKLDRKRQKWIEVKDMGDKVLFIGDDCRFSAMASDLNACKGNCVLFADDFLLTPRGDDPFSEKRCDIGVYDMESGKICALEDFRVFSELFWPPPAWITSKTT